MGNDERDQLLRRFMKVVGEPAGSDFFDEEELVELFDYTGDLGDDFLRIEVLLWGARLYPESVALSERRAALYYDLGNDSALQKVMKNVPDSSVLKRILSLRASGPDSAAAQAEMEAILHSVKDFKDEEIIRFVQTGCELGLYSWLKEHKAQIVARCSFPQSFLYELIPYAEENGDYDYIIQLLEELTDLEPFNSEFWEMLADYLDIHFSDAEKTLNAAEYALAIDPDSMKAAVLKASAMYQLKQPFKDIEQILRNAMTSHPDENSPVHLLADLYASEKRLDDAIDLLKEYVSAHPNDRVTLSYLISGTQGKLDEKYLRHFYELEKPDYDQLVEWSRSALQQFRPIVALEILKLVSKDDFMTNDEPHQLLITALYAAREYTQVRERFMVYKMLCETSSMLFNMNVGVLYALSALAWADTPEKCMEAIDVIEWMENGAAQCATEQPCMSVQEAITRNGVKEYLSKIKAMLKSGQRYDADKFNPFLKGVYGL